MPDAFTLVLCERLTVTLTLDEAFDVVSQLVRQLGQRELAKEVAGGLAAVHEVGVQHAAKGIAEFLETRPHDVASPIGLRDEVLALAAAAIRHGAWRQTT